MSNLVLFDHQCSFCQKRILFLLKIDTQKKFLFAPLKGKTANFLLTGKQAYLKHTDRMILIENFDSDRKTFWSGGKAAMRILFLIGRTWKILGLFYLLPAFIIDPIYHFIARHRYAFGKKSQEAFEMPPDRFLD